MPADAICPGERAHRTNSVHSYPFVADRGDNCVVVPHGNAARTRGSARRLAPGYDPPARSEESETNHNCQFGTLDRNNGQTCKADGPNLLGNLPSARIERSEVNSSLVRRISGKT